jgi:hypothetical protein
MTHFKDAVKDLLWIKNRLSTFSNMSARWWQLPWKILFFGISLSGRNYRNFEVSMKRYLFDSCVAMWEFHIFPLFWRSLTRLLRIWKRKTLIEFISSSHPPLFILWKFFSSHAICWKIIEFLLLPHSHVHSEKKCH